MKVKSITLWLIFTLSTFLFSELYVNVAAAEPSTRKNDAELVVANGQKLQQFDMEQVNIIDPYYVNAFNKDVEYLKMLDADRLVAGFRAVAGLPTKATVYGGWENTLLKGHTLGHYMSAIAQAYKQSKKNTVLATELKTKVDYIIGELEECQNANSNGYLFATPETHFDSIEGKAAGKNWVPWYTMHKILAGLIDVYKYEGNEKALQIASKLGDWVYDRTSQWDEETQKKVLNIEYGGMNDCLYELYKITKNENHLAAAHKFDQEALFTPVAEGKDILGNRHANTTIPKFIGAVNRFRTLGSNEVLYLTAAENFWDMVIADHTYVTGGNSENEHFRPIGTLDAYRDNINDETCNTYNMLKLTRELFKITGDVKYANYYETALINEIMASQNPETGMTTYFKAMGTGYFKVFSSETEHFWCCTGTGMENFTKLNDSLYYHTDTDLYVNMYVSSRLEWWEQGLSLSQEANLPESDTVTFKIDGAPQNAVTIKFRSPAWVAQGQNIMVAVNGKPINTAVVNGYMQITSTWAVGDVVILKFPMEMKASRLPDNKNAVAFTYGPVVLSAGLGTENMITASHGIQVLKATIPPDVKIKGYINIKDTTVDDWLMHIKNNMVKTEGKVEFTLRHTDEDACLKFTPHYKRYKDRYGIYFNLAEEDSALLQAQIIKIKESNKKADAAIDEVQITNDQHELAHNLQGNSLGASDNGTPYRVANKNLSAADGAGWFSYDMVVNPLITNYLCLKYYSGDAGKTFNIYIDGMLLKEETLEQKTPASFYEAKYLIPAKWIAGKQSVIVKIANRGKSEAGRIYDAIRILKD